MVLTEIEKKERRRIANKKYSESVKGKKKIMENNKKYSKTKKRKEWTMKYIESEKGTKAITKGSWKSQGLNMENFEEIYERYTMAIFCDICECILNQDNRSRKSMDHCHITGEFRNIVCHSCNISICK